MDVMVSLKTIDCNFGLLSNAPMLNVMLLDVRNVMFCKLEHSANKVASIIMTLSGIVTDAKVVQPRNAPPSIVVTLSGMETDTRPVQVSNA